MNPQTVQQNVNAAQTAGNANQQALNAQSGQLQGQYGQAVNSANDARTQATNAANSIQNGGALYGQNLNTQEQALGFNPADMGTAAKNLTAIQNQIAYAPTAAQQAGNYSGAASGGSTNQYAALMANLNPGLTNATNSMGNLTNLYNAAGNVANQQTGLTVQSEQNKASDLQGVYASATQQMQAAGTTMAAIEQLQQQQGYVTAQTVTQYQDAYSKYITAKAAATSAAAAMSQASTAASIAPSTIAQQQSQAALYGTQNQAKQNEIAAQQALAAKSATNTAPPAPIVNPQPGQPGSVYHGLSLNLGR